MFQVFKENRQLKLKVRALEGALDFIAKRHDVCVLPLSGAYVCQCPAHKLTTKLLEKKNVA